MSHAPVTRTTTRPIAKTIAKKIAKTITETVEQTSVLADGHTSRGTFSGYLSYLFNGYVTSVAQTRGPKQKAHLFGGLSRGEKVSGLCAEGLETGSSAQSLEDAPLASQEKKHFKYWSDILLFIRHLPGSVKVYLEEFSI